MPTLTHLDPLLPWWESQASLSLCGSAPVHHGKEAGGA